MSDGSTSAVSVTYTATGGTITSGGLYTAGANTGTFSVVATEAGGLADTASVTIAVAPPPPPNSGLFEFGNETVGAAPTGWTETAYPANSSWAVMSDASAADGVVLRNTTTATGRHILRLDAVPDTATVEEVVVRMRLGDADTRGPGVALRHSMNGSLETAYVAYFRPSQDVVEVNMFWISQWGFIASIPFQNDPGQWYWLRFRAEGSTLSVRVWADGVAEPTTWSWQGQNGSITAGSVGVYTYEPNTVDYDAFGYALQGGTAPRAAGAIPAPAVAQHLLPGGQP
jgi:hypothetical protein